MFGWSRKKTDSSAGANPSEPGGVENFANMLNNMGAGGTKLAVLMNHLNSRGTTNYTTFLNLASPEESKAFSDWIERASEGEIHGICDFFNKPPSSDPARIKDGIVRYVAIRNEQMARKTVSEPVRPSAAEPARPSAAAPPHPSAVSEPARPSVVSEPVRPPSVSEPSRSSASAAPAPANDADMLRFRCPHCKKKLKANISAAGKKATCNKCGQKMRIPRGHSRKAAALKPRDAFAKAVRELRHNNFEVRIKALAKLRLLKNRDAVEPLIQLLHDCDPRIRQETAYSLENLGDPRAVSPLIVALNDVDADVRHNVARALGVLKDERAVDPLCAHLRDPDNIVRFYVARALGRIGNASALPFLRQALVQTAQEEARRAIEEAIAVLQPAAPAPPPVPQQTQPPPTEAPAPEPQPQSPSISGRDAARRFNDMSNTADPELAERHLRSAIDADPHWAIPYCNLGKLYFRQGHLNEARQCFMVAHQLANGRMNPGDDLVCEQCELHLRKIGTR